MPDLRLKKTKQAYCDHELDHGTCGKCGWSASNNGKETFGTVQKARRMIEQWRRHQPPETDAEDE